MDFADLDLSNVASPASASSGQLIHLTWTVANNGIGPTDASSWSDRVVLSSDDVYGNADDAYLTSVQHDRGDRGLR